MISKNKVRFTITFSKESLQALEDVEKETKVSKSLILEALFLAMVDSRAKEEQTKTIKA